MISDLITAMRRRVPVPEAEVALIQAAFRERSYRRHEVLLQAGQVAHEAFFVRSGVLHQYYLDESGQERTCNFAFEQDFVTDLESFSQQTRSASAIKTLTAAQCLVVRCTALVALLKISPATDAFFRSVVEEVAARSIRRTQSLLSFSPERQFLELLDTQPEIFQRVPQRYIAQYLGIAPESLSRIRKRLMKAPKS